MEKVTMPEISAGRHNLITDVAGLKVGNATDDKAMTGVTVLLADPPATAAVDVRGGAPGTRDTDALGADCFVDAVHGIVLSGGSVFGLDAASGVTAWLSERGIGLEFASQKKAIPIVPSAILFDLANGGDKAWGLTPPYRQLGIDAAEAATQRFDLGNTGAGLGAIAGTVKGGLGSTSAVWNGFTVGALVAVNAVGSVFDPRSGDLWARPFELDGEFGCRAAAPVAGPLPLDAGTKFAASRDVKAGTNTTIAVVATDARLSKPQCRRLAIMAADGMARAIRPAHAMHDGDTVFALATGTAGPADVDAVTLTWLGTLAADCLARAIGRAVCEAGPIGRHAGFRKKVARGS